ncbi:alpha/beta fold hydrolase [Micromonospora sp. NPDC007271]|uniref:thioesterase II family protein n=1 Tax=Micromonospora sp. NPDC007271 TaxID=3154587 RepID=UPI00340139D0
MWGDWLPDGFQVEPVDPPGRGRRHREPPLDRWSLLVAELGRTIRDRIDGPYLLAGHSFGALLAYELALVLERTSTPPALLLVAGRNGPTAGLSHRPIHDLPDDQLLRALGRLGGTPEAVLDEPGLIRLWLPVLRTDLRLAETYSRRPVEPLSCPIAAFLGRRDRMADPAGVLAWHRETTARFDLTVVDAGHFLMDHPDFVAAVTARLSALRPSG